MGYKSKFRKIKYYIKFIVNGKRKTPSGKKLAYIEMLHIEPNRRLLQLVRFLAHCGYTCMVHIPMKQFSMMDISGLIVADEENVIRANPCDMGKCDIILSDNVNEIPEKIRNEKRILEIKYNIFNVDKSKNSLFTPISYHPNYLFKRTEEKSFELSKNFNRKIRVLFVGCVNNKYNDPRTKPRFKINTRKEIFEYIQGNLNSDYLYQPQTYSEFKNAIENGDLSNKVVLVNIEKFSIPRDEYFNILSETTFFIHMCGYLQPFCHNQYETMSTGVIPVTQFPDIFIPSLVHEETAIVYRELSELPRILQELCENKYSNKQIETMREKCIEYYKANMGFDFFQRKIENEKTDTCYICGGEYSV